MKICENENLLVILQSQNTTFFGKMVEWSITPVLKTGVLRGTGGSNPSLSAKATKLDELAHLVFLLSMGAKLA